MQEHYTRQYLHTQVLALAFTCELFPVYATTVRDFHQFGNKSLHASFLMNGECY